MIVDVERVAAWTDMCLPTAFRPRLNFFANVSLTIADRHARSASSLTREIPPGQQRHAEQPEIARGHRR